MEHAYEYIVSRCHNVHMDFVTLDGGVRKSEADTKCWMYESPRQTQKSRISNIVANYEVHVECAHL